MKLNPLIFKITWWGAIGLAEIGPKPVRWWKSEETSAFGEHREKTEKASVRRLWVEFAWCPISSDSSSGYQISMRDILKFAQVNMEAYLYNYSTLNWVWQLLIWK